MKSTGKHYTIEKILANVKSKRHFADEVVKIFSPYGQVKNSTLIVEKSPQRIEGSCFVEMETLEQAIAAQNQFDTLLLGNRHLYFSVNLSNDFVE